jgi:DnaJ like chaperone protein
MGKVVGAVAGLALTRHPIGFAVGAALGHAWDEGWLRDILPVPGAEQGSLVAPLFGLAGAVAKADGQVSQAEVDATERLMTRMDLNRSARKRAIASFNQGKEADFDLHLAARELRAFCGFRGELKMMLVDVLADVAAADGSIAHAAHSTLARVARSLDLDERTFEAILGRKTARSSGTRSPPIADPYGVLGITPQASDGEVRRAYRRLLTRNHPDKLTARGADAEAIRVGAELTKEIIASYEQIKSLRGMK